MRKTSRASRYAMRISRRVLEEFGENKGPWYETPGEIAEQLGWGRRKAELLWWVRLQMGRKLTVRERQCIELYYFQGMTYLEAGAATGTDPSTVYRAVRRGLRKLRLATQEDTSWRRFTRRRTP